MVDCGGGRGERSNKSFLPEVFFHWPQRTWAPSFRLSSSTSSRRRTTRFTTRTLGGAQESDHQNSVSLSFRVSGCFRLRHCRAWQTSWRSGRSSGQTRTRLIKTDVACCRAARLGFAFPALSGISGALLLPSMGSTGFHAGAGDRIPCVCRWRGSAVHARSLVEFRCLPPASASPQPGSRALRAQSPSPEPWHESS